LSYGANYLFQNSLFNPETFPIAIGMLYSIELRGPIIYFKILCSSLKPSRLQSG